MVTAITNAFINTVTTIFGGIADSVVALFESIIITRDAGVDTILNTADDVIGITDLAQWMIIFMGVSFALTIFYAIFRKVA